MYPEDLIATLPLTLPGKVLREALRGHVITTGHEDGIRLEKALDAAALAVARVVVEHVLRELGKQEPAAWLVTGGKAFVDRAFMAQCVAERSAAERKDGGAVVPLYAAPHPRSEE